MVLLRGIPPPPGKGFSTVGIRRIVILSRSVASALLVASVTSALPPLGYIG